MPALNISGGQINVSENYNGINMDVLGEQVYLSLPESEILSYNIILTNVEMFGKTYWETFIRKSNFTLDPRFREAVDKNIVAWSRDKKIESIL